MLAVFGKLSYPSRALTWKRIFLARPWFLSSPINSSTKRQETSTTTSWSLFSIFTKPCWNLWTSASSAKLDYIIHHSSVPKQQKRVSQKKSGSVFFEKRQRFFLIFGLSGSVCFEKDSVYFCWIKRVVKNPRHHAPFFFLMWACAEFSSRAQGFLRGSPLW